MVAPKTRWVDALGDGVRLQHVMVNRFKEDNAMLRALLAELLVHDDHNYGPWTRGMRDRVRYALGETS